MMKVSVTLRLDYRQAYVKEVLVWLWKRTSAFLIISHHLHITFRGYAQPEITFNTQFSEKQEVAKIESCVFLITSKNKL